MNYPPPPDESCVYCDRSLRYKADDADSWAKHLAPYQVGPCCAREWIREQFKSEGISIEATARFRLTGNFRNYARQVFDAGPESDLGRWFVMTYIDESKEETDCQ